MNAEKTVKFITRTEMIAMLEKVITSFMGLDIEKSADEKMVKKSRITGMPNPYLGKGLRVVSHLITGNAGSSFENSCNNLRLRQDGEANFEVQEHLYFRYDPDSRVLGHHKKNHEAVVSGNGEQHKAEYMAIPNTKWGTSTWLDAQGNEIEPPDYHEFQNKSSDVPEDKVAYNTVRVDRITELRTNQTRYIIVKTAEVAREEQRKYDKEHATTQATEQAQA